MADEWEGWLESIVTETEEKARKKLAKKLKKFVRSIVDSAPEAQSTETEKKEEKTESKSSKKQSKKRDEVVEKEVKKVEKKEEPVSSKKRERSASKAESDNGSASIKKIKVSQPSDDASSTLSNGNEENSEEKKRFQRVDEGKALQKALILDNTYEATFGNDGYGAKANEKLKQVRGKDFRHEKTKKKRGSYRGGAIDENAVRSIDFDSD